MDTACKTNLISIFLVLTLLGMSVSAFSSNNESIALDEEQTSSMTHSKKSTSKRRLNIALFDM